MSIATVAQQPCPARSSAATADYWALTKPDINFLIGIVTFAGFYLGLPADLHPFPFLLLMNTLLGTLLVSSGASALNQFIERRFDARSANWISEWSKSFRYASFTRAVGCNV